MKLDRFTIKSQEALERAQRLASERSHQELRPEHLLAALLEDSGGTVAAVLEKLGVPREPLAESVALAMDRLWSFVYTTIRSTTDDDNPFRPD